MEIDSGADALFGFYFCFSGLKSALYLSFFQHIKELFVHPRLMSSIAVSPRKNHKMYTAFLPIRTNPYLPKGQKMPIPIYRMPFRELGLSLALMLHGGWAVLHFVGERVIRTSIGDVLFETRGKRREIRKPETRKTD